jgi:hypothetical protein
VTPTPRVGRRRAAIACLALGLGVATAAQIMAPVPGPPLYDGVVVDVPYVYLSPPPGGLGGAQGAADTIDVSSGSPLIAIATPEDIPQAQIFAAPGSLTLPPGTTSLDVRIEPIPVPAEPAAGRHVSGNVYRMSVTDHAGTPITAPASGQVSVVMRAADAQLLDGIVARFANGAWEPLKTSPAGLGGTFLAVVTEFGDFAILAPQGPSGPSAPPGAGSPPPSAAPTAPSTPDADQPITILAAAALVIAVVLAIAAYAVRRARRDAWSNPRRRG